MSLIDTHCHIHEDLYPLDREAVLKRAREYGVKKLICVGTDVQSSIQAVRFADAHDDVFASIGIHPHEASHATTDQIEALQSKKLVAIGEIGLDYFYSHSIREEQIPLLEAQLQLARDRKVPVIFHVREAFDDFWPIFHNFSGITGVLHSFTDTIATLEKALENDLFIGVNGISVFTKIPEQIAMFTAIPLEKLLLETDAPFLTPPPFRGKINEPAYVSLVASHHAALRAVSERNLSATTTANAESLFSI